MIFLQNLWNSLIPTVTILDGQPSYHLRDGPESLLEPFIKPPLFRRNTFGIGLMLLMAAKYLFGACGIW